jgi:hypothetical protein
MNQSTPTPTATKTFLVINEIWKTFGVKKVHHTKVQAIIKKHKASMAIPTYLVDLKLAKRPERGHFQMIKPLAKKNILLLDEARKKRVADNKQDVVVKPKHIISLTEDALDAAIAFLKSKGYKVMQPVTEFKEV